jgi:hypothetical protein
MIIEQMTAKSWEEIVKKTSNYIKKYPTEGYGTVVEFISLNYDPIKNKKYYFAHIERSESCD